MVIIYLNKYAQKKKGQLDNIRDKYKHIYIYIYTSTYVYKPMVGNQLIIKKRLKHFLNE